ncbi:hypothetical protein [Rathayibacter sp. PhB127]|uniref:hypothetical protein n=1 Tax=Rathayibacter sp. PhB127 TaxID=2485176 RepID=UPI0011CE588A|nr:hypothetical protein [Rathayibacter sp. PhB127]
MRRTYGAVAAAALSLVLLTACAGGAADSAEEPATTPCATYSEMPRNVYTGETSIELEKKCITFAPMAEEAPTPSLTPTPETADDLVVNYTTSDGYTGRLTVPVVEYLYESSITNAAPGFTDIVMLGLLPATFENTTEGRAAYVGAVVDVATVYDAASPVCALDSNTLRESRVVLQKSPSFCYLFLGVLPPADMGPGDVLSVPVQDGQRSTTITDIPEDQEPALVAALNAPVSFVVMAESSVSTAPVICQTPELEQGKVTMLFSYSILAATDPGAC